MTGLHALALLATLHAQAPELDPRVLERALVAADRATAAGVPISVPRLTVIDYSLPSTARRLWTFDLESGKLLFHELVAHGMGTGENEAQRFSNADGSKQSSLGLFLTDDSYEGKNGYSLRLHGLEPGINDRAYERTIVVHGAWYVSEQFACEHGRIGRSWGCPAVPTDVAPRLIDAIRGGSLLFAWYPDRSWLARSAFVSGPAELVAQR